MHTVTSILICVVISAVVTRRTFFTCDCESLSEVKYYCSNNGDSEWKCRAQCQKCAEGKKYHCAKRYDSPKIPDYETGTELFTEGCAIEKKCKQGEEPVLTFIVNQKKVKDPVVYCEKCYNKNMYNPKLQRNSSTYSKCDSPRENKCTKDYNKIACSDPGSSSDRSCRCDARRGYMPESVENGKMCSTENWTCILKDCFDGEQMLLNYTCARDCPQRTNRSEESDDCMPSRTRKTNPTTDFKISQTTPKQIITTSETRISPTTTKQIVRSTEPSVTNNTGLIVVITVHGIILFFAIVLSIWFKDKLLGCCRKCLPTLSTNARGSGNHGTSTTFETNTNQSGGNERDPFIPGNENSNNNHTEEKEPVTQYHPTNDETIKVEKIHRSQKIQVENEKPVKQTPTDDQTVKEQPLTGSAESEVLAKSKKNTGEAGPNVTYITFNKYLGNVHYDNATNIKYQGTTRGEDPTSDEDNDVNETTSLSPSADETGNEDGRASPLSNNSGVGGCDSRQMNQEEDLFNSNNDRAGTGKPPLATPEDFSLLDEEVEDSTISEGAATEILRNLSSCKDFSLFQKQCSKNVIPLPNLEHSFGTISSCQKYDHHCPDGFKAYETSGTGNSCLYQSISFLLVGDESYQNRLRLASTVRAVLDFERYKTKLSTYSKKDLDFFFGENLKNIENMNYEEKEDLINVCLRDLIMDTAKLGNDSSRFQVLLLSAVLEREIVPHFQEDINANIQETITLDIQFDSSKSPFHIFWVNSSGKNSDMNHIVPLLKE